MALELAFFGLAGVALSDVSGDSIALWAAGLSFATVISAAADALCLERPVSGGIAVKAGEDVAAGVTVAGAVWSRCAESSVGMALEGMGDVAAGSSSSVVMSLRSAGMCPDSMICF